MKLIICQESATDYQNHNGKTDRNDIGLLFFLPYNSLPFQFSGKYELLILRLQLFLQDNCLLQPLHIIPGCDIGRIQTEIRIIAFLILSIPYDQSEFQTHPILTDGVRNQFAIRHQIPCHAVIPHQFKGIVFIFIHQSQIIHNI